MIANVYIGNIATAAGTANAITASYVPAPTVLADKMILYFRAIAANTTTTPTFSPNNLTAHTIVKQGGQALAAGDIPAAGAIMEVVYDEANTRWELLNPAAASRGYKVYSAKFTDTSPTPTVTVIENTIGTINWASDGLGTINVTCASLFTAGKTLVFFTPTSGTIGPNVMTSYIYGGIAVGGFTILTYDITSGSPSLTTFLTGASIEIRVYP